MMYFARVVVVIVVVVVVLGALPLFTSDVCVLRKFVFICRVSYVCHCCCLSVYHNYVHCSFSKATTILCIEVCR